jgi:hypothetical protein
MDLSSSRILTASTLSNTIIIPAMKNSSSYGRNLINPLQIGDASLQKLRTITTTPMIKSTIDSSHSKPTVFIMNNNSSIKTEPQQMVTINRLLLSNNNNPNSTIITGQNTINLATFVNSLNTLGLLQSTPTQNSISKLLETPINVVQQPSNSQNSKYLNS